MIKFWSKRKQTTNCCEAGGLAGRVEVTLWMAGLVLDWRDKMNLRGSLGASDQEKGRNTVEKKVRVL